MESPLYALEVNPERMKEEFQSASQNGDDSVKHFMNTMGLGTLDDKVVILVLDAAGKTTILYKLHIREVLSTVPTIGYGEHE